MSCTYNIQWSLINIAQWIDSFKFKTTISYLLSCLYGNGYTFLFATSGNIGYVATGNNGYTLPSDATDDNGYALS